MTVRHCSRFGVIGRGAVVATGLLVLVPSVANAQTQGGSDRNGVMLWTTVVIVLSLALCTVGYLYRRTRGMDHPTPDEIEMMGGGHGHLDEAPHAAVEQSPVAAHH